MAPWPLVATCLVAAWAAGAALPFPVDVSANARDFADLFETQLFVHATTLDFCALSLLSVGLALVHLMAGGLRFLSVEPRSR